MAPHFEKCTYSSPSNETDTAGNMKLQSSGQLSLVQHKHQEQLDGQEITFCKVSVTEIQTYLNGGMQQL